MFRSGVIGTAMIGDVSLRWFGHGHNRGSRPGSRNDDGLHHCLPEPPMHLQRTPLRPRSLLLGGSKGLTPDLGKGGTQCCTESRLRIRCCEAHLVGHTLTHPWNLRQIKLGR